MKPKIEVVPYNPEWAEQFAKEASKIGKALGDVVVEIHHIGSTAVKGLASKPKIDIIAEVNSLHFDHSGLIQLGYKFCGGYSIPLRQSFTYRSPGLKVNLHVFEIGDPEIELNLLFRDYLKEHDDVRDEYAKLKYQLIKEDASHVKNGMMYRGYTLGKYDLICRIVKETGYNRIRMLLCSHYKEWGFVETHLEDVNRNQTEHNYLVLYQGMEIIGCAHVFFTMGNQAEIREIVFSDPKVQVKHEGLFREMIVKWLDLINIDIK